MRHRRLPSTDLAAAPANIWLWDMSSRLSHSLACQTVRGKVSEVISQLIYLIRGLSSNPLCLTILRLISLLVCYTGDDSAGSSWLSIQFSHHQLNKAYLSLSSILLWHNWLPRCVRSFYKQHSSFCYMLAGWTAAMEARGRSCSKTGIHKFITLFLFPCKGKADTGLAVGMKTFWNVLKQWLFKGREEIWLTPSFCSIILKKSRNNLL